MRFLKLLQRIQSGENAHAAVCLNETYTYAQLETGRRAWLDKLKSTGITSSQIIGLQTDYSFNGIALFLALLSNNNIVALLPRNTQSRHESLEICHAQACFSQSDSGEYNYEALSFEGSHKLLDKLKQQKHPGFIIFSSGSSGKPKAILHDIERFLIKFETTKKCFRTLSFLLFDHIAGLDTLFYTLWCGGCLVFPSQRDANNICQLVEKHRVEVLPASPSFLNLLCLSGAYERYDLSSLKIITYGSEPMSEQVLHRLTQIFPDTKIIQKYGASEFGAPMSRSQSNDTLWIRLDNEHVKTRVIDDVLWMKSDTAMLGYLNAENPFDEDGWFCTGDQVETDGQWLHIIGRTSDIINVGGEKVFPAEVEAAIMQLNNVVDAVVYGEQSPFLGNIVCTKVKLQQEEPNLEFEKRLRKHCINLLEKFKIPVKIEISKDDLTTERHKKKRAYS
jgi:acyl-coenzyme A synthetase/AMP-(fatty) acid ligase